MQIKICLAVFLTVISTCFAFPTTSSLARRAGTPTGYGVHDGFNYAWWTDGAGNANYTNGPGGSYSVTWAGNQGNFFGGKGWSPGSTTRVVSYEGTFEPKGNGYLSLYAWEKNFYNDYYVMESYGTYNPTSGGPLKGTITCDGARYDVIYITRVSPGLGTPIIHNTYSVRNPKRPTGFVSGTIDFSCHVAGWAGLGIKLTNLDYQVLATEGYFSSGFSNITVL